MNTYVVVRCQFEATHSWPGCDIAEVEYLRYRHRHVFHVEMKWEVRHDDREKEFIVLKHRVKEWIGSNLERWDLPGKSCEMICKDLQKEFNCSFVSVFEDGENGAELWNM